ncbi:MAG: cell division protein FtsZ [Verrucomicrobiales bacterium]|jgi:cell division protein FtsZ
MIEFTRSSGPVSEEDAKMNVRVVGVGGAGSNVIDRIAVDGSAQENLILCNTDVRALTTSIAGVKIQLGKSLTMGLGCGGDPELGREAALQATDEIRQAVNGADMIFVCVGLGGGTGSGAAPVIAKIAREEGCFVVVFATMPFRFEGRRRLQQANMALSELKGSAHALLTFENDRMGELIVPKDGVRQAFAAADKTICQSIRAICSLVEQPGMVRIGMDDLLAVLKGKDTRCLFGFGQASGKDRVKRSVRAALDNPLLDRGELLSEGANVLVHISGGENLKLAEVEDVMTALGEHVDDSAQLLFGVSTSKALEESLCVAIISSVDRERLAASKNAREAAEKAKKAEEARLQEEAHQAELQKKALEAQQVEEARAQKEAERAEKEHAALAAAEAAQRAAQAAVEARKEAERAEEELRVREEAETEAESAAEAAADFAEEEEAPEAPSVMTVVAPNEAEFEPVSEIAEEEEAEPSGFDDSFGQSDPEPESEAESTPVARVKHTPVISQTVSELKPPVRPSFEETGRVPIVKPSIFSIVDDTSPKTSTPKPSHPKVKIEFADEEESDVPGDPAPSPTITLQPVEPSVALQDADAFDQAPEEEPEAQLAGVDNQLSPAPSEPVEVAPLVGVPDSNGSSASPTLAKVGTNQQLLDFDSPSRGRFDKGEPTIVDGEDLDIPTFLRKKKRAG